MRIISGKYRGKIITAPADLSVRPTTDFAKTGLFNIINSNYNLSALSVLDLFAGSGSISYEFVSRGCKNLIAIDKNPKCVYFIQQTFEKLNIVQAHATKNDALQYLEKTNQTFDIIFADPPFDLEVIADLHKLIFDKNLLNKKGMFVFEHESSKDYSTLESFEEIRKYGNVSFSFFKNKV